MNLNISINLYHMKKRLDSLYYCLKYDCFHYYNYDCHHCGYYPFSILLSSMMTFWSTDSTILIGIYFCMLFWPASKT